MEVMIQKLVFLAPVKVIKFSTLREKAMNGGGELVL